MVLSYPEQKQHIDHVPVARTFCARAQGVPGGDHFIRDRFINIQVSHKVYTGTPITSILLYTQNKSLVYNKEYQETLTCI